MDPKQTSPLGNNSVGGQEGQFGQPATPQPVFGTAMPPSTPQPPALAPTSTPTPTPAPTLTPTSASAPAPTTSPTAAQSPAPFATSPAPFSEPTAPATPPATSAPAVSPQPVAGTLGSDRLSTGANVSRTMDSLNNRDQSATNTPVFSRHKFDKTNPNGDILLPESGPAEPAKRPENRARRTKLVLIIGGIVAVGLIAAIIVVLIMGNKKPTSNNSSSAPTSQQQDTDTQFSTTDLSYQETFNVYANWLFWGETSTNKLDATYEQNMAYQLDYSLANDGSSASSEAETSAQNDTIASSNKKVKDIDKTTFFADAANYYNDFMEKFNNSDISSNEYISNNVAFLTDNFNFLYNYAKFTNLAESEVAEHVAKDGLSATNEYIEEHYQEIATSTTIGAKYRDLAVPYYQALAAKYSLYEESNCLSSEGTVDMNCSTTVARDQNEGLSSLRSNFLIGADEIVGLAVKDTLQSCILIAGELENPTEFPNETQDVKDTENTDSSVSLSAPRASVAVAYLESSISRRLANEG